MVSRIRYRRLLILLMGAFALYCIFMVIKPGASIFYYPRTLNRERIEQEGAFVYRYTLKTNILLEAHGRSQFFEDEEALRPSTPTIVHKRGNGRFALTDPLYGQYHLYFASGDNSDPRTNGRAYRLLQPIIIFSRPFGIFYLAILLLGLAVYAAKYLQTSEQRQAVKVSAIQAIKESLPNRLHIKRLFILITASAYLYVFMEWLFFITKPSFMDVMQLYEKIEIFLLSGFVISMIGLLGLLVFATLDFLFSYLKLPQIWIVSGSPAKPVLKSWVSILGLLIPSSILTVLAFLMIDNFTYVLFDFGVVSSTGIQNTVYALIVIGLLAYFYRYQNKYLTATAQQKQKSSSTPMYLVCGLLLMSGILALMGFERQPLIEMHSRADENQQVPKLPHILLLGSDGVNAGHMSVYGYERDTTPNIKKLAEKSLVAENAFTNAAHSAGSVISILTSKLPTQTRVLYPPDILNGSDAFLHLPGILRSAGYKTVEIGVPHYVDAYNMNLQDGFDFVNGVAANESTIISFLKPFGYTNTVYFISKLEKRVIERLYHIFNIEDMVNPYAIVTQPYSLELVQGIKQKKQLIDLLNSTKQPLFVHMHLIGTHGPFFFPEERVFSAGQEQIEEWMVDFYDDAILDFDTYIGELIDTLKENGQLNNTILVIYSDHGHRFALNERLPLIIHFPNNQHLGRIQENVQNLDISPTIVDYLHLPPKQWMVGNSLLEDNYPERSLIFSMGTRNPLVVLGDTGFILDTNQIRPPFYQFGYVNINYCQKWYRYELLSHEWYSGEIEGHTAPCAEDLPNQEEIVNALREHLSSTGFNTSSIR